MKKNVASKALLCEVCLNSNDFAINNNNSFPKRDFQEKLFCASWDRALRLLQRRWAHETHEFWDELARISYQILSMAD